jgi:hypothetical protein
VGGGKGLGVRDGGLGSGRVPRRVNGWGMYHEMVRELMEARCLRCGERTLS